MVGRPLWDHAEAMAPRDRLRLGTMHRGEDRLIAGVCSGIAESLRVDPIIVRDGVHHPRRRRRLRHPALPRPVVPHARARAPAGSTSREESISHRSARWCAARVRQPWPSAGRRRHAAAVPLVGLWFSDAARVAAHARRLRCGAAVGADRRRRAGPPTRAASRLPGRPFEALVGGRQSRSASASGPCSCSPASARSSPPTTRSAAARQVAHRDRGDRRGTGVDPRARGSGA